MLTRANCLRSPIKGTCKTKRCFHETGRAGEYSAKVDCPESHGHPAVDRFQKGAAKTSDWA